MGSCFLELMYRINKIRIGENNTDLWAEIPKKKTCNKREITMEIFLFLYKAHVRRNMLKTLKTQLLRYAKRPCAIT